MSFVPTVSAQNLRRTRKREEAEAEGRRFWRTQRTVSQSVRVAGGAHMAAHLADSEGEEEKGRTNEPVGGRSVGRSISNFRNPLSSSSFLFALCCSLLS